MIGWTRLAVSSASFDFRQGPPRVRHWRSWSFDEPSFERLVDRVEQHPAFADLLTQEPIEAAVYWQDAW